VRFECEPTSAALIPDPDGGFTVTFRDVPEAITEGILGRKRYCASRTPPIGARHVIAAGQLLPVSSGSSRARNWCRCRRWEWRRRRYATLCVRHAKLARRLRWHLPQVARTLDLRHASRMERIKVALVALGLRLIVDVANGA
jgi:antitoxin HicB